ncbi:hypothetical protein BJ912DRAFT_973963 [Pholiota molesta]|nr:hypothetical protein BJ912DRAFT_973963 [Pholiota molesta]
MKKQPGQPEQYRACLLEVPAIHSVHPPPGCNGFYTCALGVLATDNNLCYGQFMPSTSKPLSPLHPSLLAIREVCVDLNLNSGISTNFRNRLIGRGTHAVSVSIMKLNDEEHGCASHHLPSVLYEAFLSNAAHRQSWILVDLDKWGIERKKKLLQSSVMTELLPVTQLTNSDTLLPIIRDVFHCYKCLYKGAKIMHRGINPSNIMYCEDGNEIYGVLIDFDFSSPLSRQRMGTMPYMALDLLQPIPTKYLYRHDLESLFYVVFVLVTRYDGGEEIEDPPLQDWFELPPELLRLVKPAFFQRVPPPSTSAFESIYPLLREMFLIFHAGFEARFLRLMSPYMKKDPRITSVDHWQAILDSVFNETLGGNVDFDAFQRLLQQ